MSLLYILGVYMHRSRGDQHAQEFYNRLSAKVSEFQVSGQVILMGDFNARTGLGAETGDAWRNHDWKRNTNGGRLRRLVWDNRLEYMDLPATEPPFTTRIQDRSKSVIDYILWCRVY
jgi:endonuclease/exonuclease/phosphatase family metal-dependent hydrolase